MADDQPTTTHVAPQSSFDPKRYLDEISPDLLVARVIHPGEPLGKHRPRMNKKTGRVYTPRATAKHQQSLALAASPHIPAGPPPEDWAFGIRSVFYVGSHQRKDVDNMLKSVLDAMNHLAFADDSQVREVMGWAVFDPDRPRTEFVIYKLHPIVRDHGVCERCGVPFRRYKSWTSRRFCGRRCLAIATSKKVEVPCSVCGVAVLRTPSKLKECGKVYCSGGCYETKHRIVKPCAICGATITRPTSLVRTGQTSLYCSLKCWSAAPRKKQFTPERLAEIAKKGWETRRAKKNP